MPFKQGVRPCLVLDNARHRRFRAAMPALGYARHRGLRTTREGELCAWVRGIGRDRQVHVQEVRADDGRVEVFAHTEPAGETLSHLISAVLDQASFSGGARVLRNDLRSRDWDV